MGDFQTVNGSVLLNTDPSALTMPLSVSRTDLSVSDALAQITMLGSGTNNLQGAIVLKTMVSGLAAGPLEERMRVHTNGNVGIGTATPVNKLDVGGDVAVLGKHALRGNDTWLRLNQDGAFPSGVFTPGNFAPNALNVGSAGNPGPGNAWIAGTLQIGANPVLFSSAWTGFPDTATNHAEISNDIGTYKTLMIVGNKSAGIGRRVSIWDRLEVNGFLQSTGGAILNGVAVGAPAGAGINSPYPYESVGVTNTGFNLRLLSTNSIFFHSGNNSNPRVKIGPDGNLGTAGFDSVPRTPGWGGGIHTWDVEAEGTIWSHSGYQSGPRDLAENYLSDDELEPGDIVCLHPDKDKIVKSTLPNDPMAIGAVSAKPGVLLNVDYEAVHDGAHFPVALCGRVPCKVVDENGPINKGDLLTSSSTPGHAMKAIAIEVNDKAIYRPGTIIGKALEIFDGGHGTIEMFAFSC